MELGRAEEAERTFRTRLSNAPDEPMARAGLVRALLGLGRRAALEWARALERDAASLPGQAAVSAAWSSAAIGEIDRAFAWLDRAIDKREALTVSVASFSWWDPLRSDVRFDQALHRLGLSKWRTQTGGSGGA